MRKWAKRLAVAAALLGAVAIVASCVAGLWLRHELYASLPVTDGTLDLDGLTAPVTVERDALGVPTIRGQNRLDVARATGFVHAQERFFQMDLLRRRAAGELSAIVGSVTLDQDVKARIHRFRMRAERGVADLDEPDRKLIEVYTEGVNAGLAALGAAPPEYLVLGVDPAPWSPADSLLVVYTMYLDLQDATATEEKTLGVLTETLPAEVVAFLAPVGTGQDAPLIGEPLPDPPLPPPEVYDLRQAGQIRLADHRVTTEIELPAHAGSNNWAVASAHSAGGGALLASDMHLGLRLPNIWFRVSFVWAEPTRERRVTGLTLPGTPLLVAGSNGDVAWSFTNTELDFADLVVLETDASGERYETANGWLDFETHVESIEVMDAEPAPLEVRETIWGPVIGEDAHGRALALRWVAHDVGAADLGLAKMEQATDLEAAIEIAVRARIPTQNCVIADSRGRVGWTLMGPLPHRSPRSGRVPVLGRSESVGWDGFLPPEAHPRIVDPPAGRVWTANNRVAGTPEWIATLGAGHVAFGARARQIRDRLLELPQATARDMLAVQLDDRALLLERWRGLLLEVLDDEAISGNARRAELRRIVREDWSGRASTDSAGYRLVRAFRMFVAEAVLDAITAPCRAVDENCSLLATNQWEAPLWRLVTERPQHLLDPRFESWREQLLHVVDAVLDHYEKAGGGPLAEQTWGRRNTVRVSHPISGALPAFLAERIDAAPVELPGDIDMPRVQTPGFGASERFVVSPGREEEGLFNMPGGQSGHPLSPYYLAGHETWIRGEPAPFLPGPTAHRLTLVPRTRSHAEGVGVTIFAMPGELQRR